MRYLLFIIIVVFCWLKIDWKIKHRFKRLISFSRFQPNQNDILFCGDSNIELLNFNLFKPFKTYNYGISGEKINGLNKRVKKILQNDSDQIFFVIGINDVLANHSNEIIKNDFHNLFNNIHKFSKGKKITFISLYPLRQNNNYKSNLLLLNDYIRQQCYNFDYDFLDVYKYLEDDSGFLSTNFSNDGIHLNQNGQKILIELINLEK